MDQALINFDSNAASLLKEVGLELASLSREKLLETAKTIAFELAERKGSVTYDDVFKEMLALGMHPECMGNAAGAVFRGKHFEFTGEWRKSSRESNHSRVNRVWRLKE